MQTVYYTVAAGNGVRHAARPAPRLKSGRAPSETAHARSHNCAGSYDCTTNYIRHTGNVVDLMEYRRKLERAAALPEPESPEELRPAVKRRRRSRMNPGLALDFCASAAIVVLTVTVMIQFLVF